jgi:hypothetical protein
MRLITLRVNEEVLERTFGQGGFRPENKLLAGVDVPLRRGLLLEFYWRRDFNAPVSDRLFAGVRYELRGRF